ncbi:MAG: citrate lyase holo-[acyl-carrier protein] synthase, partial [Lactobacillus amylovorus]|nr:citrate lyase holo-[acyl-carrier protein] synthase [Lactobacillus amylovorus]
TTIYFEDHAELVVLFYADVLEKYKNAAISRRDLGPSPRKCFICDRPAKECARSRRHSVAEMQDYISELYAKNVK